MKKLITKFKNTDKKKKFTITALVIFIIAIGLVLAKYTADVRSEHYYESKNFYFDSTVLSVEGSYYEVANWSGTGDYEFEIDITNMANDLEFTEKNIEYDLDITCSASVACTSNFPLGGDILNGTSGVKKAWTVNVSPLSTITEPVTIDVKATSISPYKKELSASVKISISGITYKIDDKVNQLYSNLILTNGLDTAQNVTLSFDPTEVNIDMTNSLVMGNNNITTTSIGGKTYINSIILNLAANSSSNIFFYKKDISENYGYPLINDSPIINIS